VLYINDNNPEVKRAKDNHSKLVSTYLKRHPVSEITNFVNSNLDKILNGKPSELITINNAFYSSLKGFSSSGYSKYLMIKNIHYKKRSVSEKSIITKFEKLHKKVNEIINYEGWFIKSSKKPDYRLASDLNRNTCTYCNRSYIHTIVSSDDEKIMRPQFDHWFPKSKFPLLALSFYNLIPSCSSCNSSIKGGIDLNISDHIHPYLDDIADEFTFTYEFDKGINKYKIDIETDNKRIANTVNEMCLTDVYNSHESELCDLIRTEQAYSKDYLDILFTAFPDANLNKNEMYRIAFGVEKERESYHKLPLSKFKKDILKRLKIVY
jgi:hypothetical protein